MRTPRLAVALAAVLLVSACGGGADGSGERSDDASRASDGGPAGTGCDLLTDEEIADSTGDRPVRARTDALGNGCVWEYDRGVVGTALVLQISPEQSTRDGEPASTFAGLVENRRRNRIPVREQRSLGDEAVVVGGATPNQVIVRDGDAVVVLTLNDLDRVEDGTMVGLMRTVLARDPGSLLG